MDPDAWRMMSEMTGFDIRTLSANLEKLIQYAGDAPTITAGDVGAVLERTRQDPVWELTGAVSERNVRDALFYLGSLLEEGLVPLQILAAVINAMRRMLLAKGFVVGPAGQAWRSGMRYNDFQRSVMPAIQAHDEALLSSLAEWDAAKAAGAAADADDDGAGARGAQGAAQPKTDLVLAPKGRSAYPIYLLLKNSKRFKLTELVDILEDLQRTDVKLKTSGGPPRRLLEAVIIRICQGR
jgi:DNA polymerase-3 subunit delta